MRNPRAPFLISGALLILGGIAYLMYEQQLRMLGQGASGFLTPQVGRTIFSTLIFTELALVIFMAPALTAGAVSGERERQTLDLLLCTPVSATSIILGKLASSLMFILLILFVSIPLFSVVFLFGGVAPGLVVSVFVILVVTAIVIGAIGLFASTIIKRSTGATVLAFALTFAYMVAPVAAGVFIPAVFGHPPEAQSLYLQAEPVYALIVALNGPVGGPPVLDNASQTCVSNGTGGESCTTQLYGAPGGATRTKGLTGGPFGESWRLFIAFSTVLIAALVSLAVLALSGRISLRLPKSKPAPSTS